MSAAPAGGYTFTGFGGALSGTATPQTLTLSSAATVTASFAVLPTTTISTYPVGLSVTVDGSSAACNPYCSFQWVPGSPHSIGASTQPGTTGTHWLWASWSDGGAVSHGVTASSSGGGYTASFNPQYYFTSSVSPAGTGTIAPGSGWYNAGASFWVTETPNTGYQFSSFSPGGQTYSFDVVMNGPVGATANFAAFAGQSITSNPPGASFTVDGTGCIAPCSISWSPGTLHTISTTSPQSPSLGTQLLFSSWSDGGAISHTVTAAAGVTYTATFTTQYLLTTVATPAAAGTISPTTGWYNSGQVVQVTATPNSGAPFAGFSGGLTGTANPQNVTMSGPVSVTANFTTNFTLMPANQNANLAIPANSSVVPATYAFSSGNPNCISSCGVYDGYGNLSQYVTAAITRKQTSSLSVQYSAAPGAVGSGQSAQLFPICNCFDEECPPIPLPPVNPVSAPIVAITGPLGVAQGGSDVFTVSISGAVLDGPINIRLNTTQGTGSATFADGTTSATINSTGTVNFTLNGVQASSTANNITIQADYGGAEPLASQQFSVVWVTIALNTGTPQQKDAELSEFLQDILGGPNPQLGVGIMYNPDLVPQGCVVAVELVGQVTPSDYGGSVTLMRNIASTAAFQGQAPWSGVTKQPGPDNSAPSLVDSTVGSGAPGEVFDLDPPGIGPGPSPPGRYRTNFQEYAVLGLTFDDNPPQASAYFPYYVAVSCGGTQAAPAVDTSVTGDNVAAPGTVPLSWNLH